MPNEFGPTPQGLASQILNLAGIVLRGGTLRVPRYQRPYTWTEREVRYLIQDLLGAFSRRMPFYFIGQIVLVKNERGEFEISDGQQRMATLTMIIAYARDRLPHRMKHYQKLILAEQTGLPLLTLRADGSGFFQGFVQEPGRMDEMTRLDNTGVDPRDLMCEAARTIAAELHKLSDEELDAFVSFICSQATFDVMDAAERGCAATVYNRANDRGLALSAADNIKCELLENSGLSMDEADKAAEKWEECEDSIGRDNFADLLNVMPFLLTGEYLVSPGDLGAFREKVESVQGGVREFLFDRLPCYADALKDIFDQSIEAGSASVDVNRRVKMMKQLSTRDWVPAALAFIAEHADEPERAKRFFLALERFAFGCELGVVHVSSRQRRFSDAARFVGDDKKLHSEHVLDLTNSERLKFIEQLNRSRKRDRSRRLLMIRLEAAMPGGSVLSVYDDVSVEHVLPSRGGRWWIDRFPNAGLRDDAANLLGNLVLITNRQNKQADNKPYPQKRQVYFESRDAPIHQVTRDIFQIEDWTLEAIDVRQERLVRILCTDWELVRGASEVAAA